jgi:CPA2 family monovalent cation:H+ antiporter-2
VVLVGYGRVGRRIAQVLDEKRIPYVVAEQNREAVEQLRARHVPAVSGDASDPAVLIQAHIAQASMLVIATPDTLDVHKMVETARTLNSTIEVVVRTHSEEEAELLTQEKIGTIFIGERELANGMVAHVLSRMAPPVPKPH